MQLTWIGVTQSLEVKALDTISDVKSKISEKMNLDKSDHDLILLYKQKPLQNSHTLLHYGILQDETLSLRQRLKGLHNVINKSSTYARLLKYC